jgi:hypothetical protein
VWTPADAAAGGTPVAISSVLEIRPNAIPRAPSMSWAANPIRMNVTRTVGSARKSVGIGRLHPVTGNYLPKSLRCGKWFPAHKKGHSAFHYARDTLN